MESTSKAFLKGATKVRPLRWSIVSVCFVMVGCLLTTTLFFNERFPDLVSIVTGGRSSIEVTDTSTRLSREEGFDDLNLARQGNQSGEVDQKRDGDFAASPTTKESAPSTVTAPAPTTLAGAPRDAARSEASQAAEESDPEGREHLNEDEKGDMKEEGEEYHFQQATFNGTLGNETMVNYTLWDSRVGCEYFREKHSFAIGCVSREP